MLKRFNQKLMLDWHYTEILFTKKVFDKCRTTTEVDTICASIIEILQTCADNRIKELEEEDNNCYD